MALVSVIIPTYNRADYLARALESVRHQSFADWELIVVDDASSDHTAEVFAKFDDPRARLLKLEKNLGVAGARNAGVEATTAPWLAFLDSDDEWLTRKLEMQLARASQYRIVHCEEIWIRKGVRVNPMKKHAKSGGRIFKRCVDLCCVSTSTTMVSRELFLEHAGFDATYPVCEDYDLWLKVAARENVGFIEEPMIRKYGGHADQLSFSRSSFDFFRIRALAPFLKSSLSLEERLHVASSIVHRAQVLLRGYEKHQNLKDLPQVQVWLAEARNFLSVNQIAHSAADLRPRSDSAIVL